MTYFGTKRVQAWPEDRDGESGYGVKYRDGYVSWSPAEAFDEAYRTSDNLTFGMALEAMKLGFRCRRVGWNGFHKVFVVQPSSDSEIGVPYISILPEGAMWPVPWVASQSDMLAEDWMALAGDEELFQA